MTIVQRLKSAYSMLVGGDFNTATVATIIGGTVTWAGQDLVSDVDDGYAGNDTVYSIIKLINDKATVAPWGEYEIVDEQKFKQYKAELSNKSFDINRVIELKEQAIRPVVTKGKISQLIEEPADDMSWRDLVEAYGGFKLSTGNAYLYGDIIQAGNNKGKPNKLHILPSQFMTIIAEAAKFPVRPVGYMLQVGYIQTFTKDQVLHDKYFNPQWSATGQELYGLSPLQAAHKLLTRSNESKTASVANLENGGPPGVLFMDTDKYGAADLTAQAKLIKANIEANYKGTSKAGNWPVSPYRVGWASTGLSPRDLQIIEAEKWDTQQLCSIYGVPPELIGATEHKTYNNIREAEKSLTTRGAIPLLISMRDALNRKCHKDWNIEKDRIFDFDLTVYEELNQSMKEKAEIANMSWWWPIKKKYEFTGEPIPDELTDEVLNQIIVPSGLQPFDQMLNVTPLDYGNSSNV